MVSENSTRIITLTYLDNVTHHELAPWYLHPITIVQGCNKAWIDHIVTEKPNLQSQKTHSVLISIGWLHSYEWLTLYGPISIYNHNNSMQNRV
jgi:hypothetical protein